MSIKNPHAIWATVAIVVVLVVGAVILILNDKDISSILTLLVVVVGPILTALGVQISTKIDRVQEEVNGKSAEKDKQIQYQQSQITELALQIPRQDERIVTKEEQS